MDDEPLENPPLPQLINKFLFDFLLKQAANKKGSGQPLDYHVIERLHMSMGESILNY